VPLIPVLSYASLLIRIFLLYETPLLIYHLAFALLHINPFTHSLSSWIPILPTLFRFDLVTIGYLSLLPFLLLPLFFHWKPFHRFYQWFIFFIGMLHILLLAIDLAYFPHGYKHLSFEILATLPDLPKLLPTYLMEYWFAIPLVSIAGYLAFYGIKKWISPPHLSRTRTLSVILYYSFGIPLFLILIRGGFQYVPITPSDAFATGNFSLGNLALNSTYTSLYALFSPAKEESLFRNISEQAMVTLQQYSRNPQDQPPPFPQYPLYRQFLSASPSRDTMNVVLIILESFSSYYSTVFNPKTHIRNLTPFLDSLAQHSHIFLQYYSPATRSIEAIPSIVNGLPNLLSTPFIGSPYEMHPYVGLGHILNRFGYTTAFFHGARKGSMVFDRHLKQAGFQLHFAMEDYQKEKGNYDYDGSWGIYDHRFFPYALHHIKQLPEPFFAVIFSLSNHHPFSLPAEYEWCKSQLQTQHPFFYTYRYTDEVLKAFFQSIWQDDDTTRWNRTIFVITADHTFIPEETDLETKHRVPLLFYNPRFLLPKQDSTPGSHLSLLPTFLQFLSLSTWHHGFAPSLFNREATHYALFQHEGIYIYKDKTHTLSCTLHQILDYQGPISERDSIFQNTLSLIKATNHLLIFNRMAPLTSP